MKLRPTERLLLLLIACAFVAGCAAAGTKLADAPRKCHAGQMLSCNVKGFGATKTYSNCRCEYPREINTGFGSID